MNQDGQSFLYSLQGTSLQLRLSVDGVFVHVWQTPRRAVYLVQLGHGLLYMPPLGEGGELRTVDEVGPAMGVWGLNDANVWAWGVRDRAPFVMRFDGDRWREVRSPRAINSMHGIASDAVYAAGPHGAVVRWDGEVFVDVAAPTKPTRTACGVAVLAPTDVVVGVSELGTGVVLRGGPDGVNEVATLEHDLLSVATREGTIYLGVDHPLGLCKLIDGEAQVFKRQFVATKLEARDHVLVTSDSDLVSIDGDTIRGYPVATIAAQLPAP